MQQLVNRCATTRTSTQALLRASTFPIPPADLIAKAKDILAEGVHRSVGWWWFDV